MPRPLPPDGRALQMRRALLRNPALSSSDSDSDTSDDSDLAEGTARVQCKVP